MSQSLKVVVAQYGHVRLAGAKHWSIVILTDPGSASGVAYQITGSTTTYEVKEPEEVRLLQSKSFMGCVEVGSMKKGHAFGTERTSAESIIRETEVVKGNIRWNCQNWVVAALRRLRDAQYDISDVSLEGLQDQLAQVVSLRDNKNSGLHASDYCTTVP
jgi:hypothetical protein